MCNKMSNHAKHADFKSLIRKTFYIRKDQNVALKIMAAKENMDEYEIVIKALDNFIPGNYTEMAQEES